MARYTAGLDSNRSPEEAFAYLSDFTTTREWDPSVVEAERVGEGPIAKGTEFRLATLFAGRTTAITYRIVEYDKPRAVSFRGENATVISLDRITFTAIDGGTRVTYDADLRLKGWLRVGDPLIALVLNRLGKNALAGLRARIGTT
jgi:carbon monoxide dehydrogenase subunit G